MELHESMSTCANMFSCLLLSTSSAGIVSQESCDLGTELRLFFLRHLCNYGHLCKYVVLCKNYPIEIEIVSAGIVSEESRVLGFKLESGHRPTRPEERTSESDSESVAPLHV